MAKVLRKGEGGEEEQKEVEKTDASKRGAKRNKKTGKRDRGERRQRVLPQTKKLITWSTFNLEKK